MIEDNGNQLILPDEMIISKIYLVRGKKVMLDKDLAELLERIEHKLLGHDENILLIFEYLRQLEQSRQQQDDQSNRKKIGFRQVD